MKKFFIVFTILSSVILGSYAHADTVIKYGVNASKENEPLGSQKSIFFADQAPIFGPIIRQYEIGGWVDNTNVPGRKSSLLGGASIGVHVNAEIFFAQALVGPSLISSPDTSLGGPFQFNNDIAFGFRDPDTKATVGFSYKHVSSGGLELPNRGRDFLMFRISLPW